MVNEVQIIDDPLGNRVRLPGHICPEGDLSPIGDVYDDVTTVISRPALLVELNGTYSPELYYYRSIGWNDVLLIAARPLGNDEWEAFDCQRNPPSSVLSELLRRGRQLI